MPFEEKTVKSEKIFDGKIVKLRVDNVELPNRTYARREIIEHANSVAVIPFKDENTVYMVKQYRKPIERVTLEFPAGIIESGEEPKDAAQRELSEEIGYGSNNLEFVYDFYSSPGFTDEKISIYTAKDLFVNELDVDEDEYIEVVEVSIKELIMKLRSLELNDATTIIATLFLEKLAN